MMRRATLALILALWPLNVWAAPEPEGYRTEAYRDPVPDTLAGARVLTPEAAHALWMAGTATFIDVLPRAPKPEGLPAGTVWREPPRDSIPGATWLPNVGYGDLAEVNHAYFRDNLARATDGDTDRPVVFFCLMDCWMSWNAAKRAMEYGYTDVMWFPDGTDGWTFYDYPTDALEPQPGGR